MLLGIVTSIGQPTADQLQRARVVLDSLPEEIFRAWKRKRHVFWIAIHRLLRFFCVSEQSIMHTTSELRAMSRGQLQGLAKQVGIRANQKARKTTGCLPALFAHLPSSFCQNIELIEQLTAFYKSARRTRFACSIL